MTTAVPVAGVGTPWRARMARGSSGFGYPALGMGAFVLLAVFVALPLGLVLVKGLLTPSGHISFDYVAAYLGKARHYRAIANSLILGMASTALLVVVAGILAFVATRGPGWLRGPLRVVALLPLIAPHYIFGVSLIILGGRQGLVTNALGLENWTIYGWSGVILSQVLSFLPIAFILIENVLKGLDPNLEDAARDQGADEATVLRTVTIPLAAPGLLKAALLVFSLAIADFANPALLGANLSFLAPDAYLLIVGEMNLPLGSVASSLLVLPCLAIFLLHHSWLKGRSFTTVGGRMVRAETRNVGPLLNAVFLGVVGAVALLILANFAVTVFGAFTVLAGVDNGWTLRHMINREGLTALGASLKVSLAVGLIGTVLGNGLAYVLMRGRVAGQRLIEFLALAGFALPGTVLGIGYLMAFNAPPLHLTNGFAILVLVTVFHALAVPLELGYSRLYQISPELEDASADLGANAWATYRRVVLPLMASSFVAGFVYTFMYSMVSVSALILLVSPGHITASVYIFQMADLGSLSAACAVTVYLVLCELGCLAVLRLLRWSREAAIRR